MRWRICIKTKKVDGCETEVVILCIHHASGRYDIHMSSAAITYLILFWPQMTGIIKYSWSVLLADNLSKIRSIG